MKGHVIRSSDGDAESPWSPREAELLGVTLELLQEHGYDRLSLDAVATAARASKATLYRRWPTKAELVLAAFVEGTRHVAVDPDTGTLRGDLLRLGQQISAHVSTHASTIRAVLMEISRSDTLAATLHAQFLSQRKALMSRVLARAVDRGEIESSAITEDLWDVLPGYLIYRSVLTGRAPTRRTIQDFVDNVLIPSLTRHND
ncbi:TetR/AcrR family transcriptional regulator [Mycolicibacterium celeriflavum]|uniref:Putative HTH-type transcriptional regulator n=1 Tax=Mycolicibacterium celeriflavum TaxID=1249101 RepID=A0A1X0BPN4_MYCCF|nr:TetR/AcrR family transcriptional regulator [Mycolicibacterium celeriflavum]ORA45188.1 TetR family transcriptional regulator [Mycolicibacterium celeriflavum]BBY44151.1 putative HTH-type transcriptional regulator [Mycolicibacterium celeriflavum]